MEKIIWDSICIRVSRKEKERIEKMALATGSKKPSGAPNVSLYLLDLHRAKENNGKL